MEVYIEVTYIINALIILLTIEILCFLLNQQLQLKEIIKTSMENEIKLRIPLKVELSEANDWYEAK